MSPERCGTNRTGEPAQRHRTSSWSKLVSTPHHGGRGVGLTALSTFSNLMSRDPAPFRSKASTVHVEGPWIRRGRCQPTEVRMMVRSQSPSLVEVTWCLWLSKRSSVIIGISAVEREVEDVRGEARRSRLTLVCFPPQSTGSNHGTRTDRSPVALLKTVVGGRVRPLNELF